MIQMYYVFISLTQRQNNCYPFKVNKKSIATGKFYNKFTIALLQTTEEMSQTCTHPYHMICR